MGRTIPILAMTANAFSEDVKDCLDAGMDALAAKPLDTAVLERTSEACRHGTSAPRNHIRKYSSPPCGKGRMGAETVEKPNGFFDKVSCRTLRAPFVRLRRTKNTLVSYSVFCVVYTPLHKMN